jgi:SWI/SNF-related matrix-associated actin-dependent regulator of chromatin subfamily A3
MVAAHGTLQDRRPLRVQELIEPAPPPAEDEEQADIATPEPMGLGDQTPSAKVAQLIELLKMQPWDSKSLVFSQFTSFLDKVRSKILSTIQYAEPVY